MKPVVAILIGPELCDRLIPPAALHQLAEVANIRRAPRETVALAEAHALLAGAHAALTGWGTPRLDRTLFDSEPQLGLIAHAAGSIRALVPLDLIRSGRIRVSHAAGHIAEAVAESIIASILSLYRQPAAIHQAMARGDEWFATRDGFIGRLLGDETVGLVGAGYVGRKVARLFAAFGCRLLIHDPVVDDELIARLGARKVSLSALLEESDIVSLHAPVLPSTKGMIGREEFRRMKAGALFINTARAALVDQAAQAASLKAGHIRAIIDVFEHEPLPMDDPARRLPHTLLAPHMAGHTVETYLRQGQSAVNDILNALQGRPLQNAVTTDMLVTMA